MIMISFTVQCKHLLPCEGLCLTVGPQGVWDTVTARPVGQSPSNRWDCYGTKNVIDTLIIISSNLTPWYLLELFESYIHTKIFTLMLIVTLFIIVKTCQQPRYPSGGESNSDIFRKWNAIKPWKTYYRLKCLLLSEKATYCMIPRIWHFGKGENLGTAKWSISRDWGWGEGWIEI